MHEIENLMGLFWLGSRGVVGIYFHLRGWICGQQGTFDHRVVRVEFVPVASGGADLASRHRRNAWVLPWRLRQEELMRIELHRQIAAADDPDEEIEDLIRASVSRQRFLWQKRTNYMVRFQGYCCI